MSQGRAADIDREEKEIDDLKEQLSQARSEVLERDFKLKATQEALARSEQLLSGWRATLQGRERELTEGEARLIEVEVEAERLQTALTSIRSSHAYRLMRIVWRLRRPFKRS